MVNSLVNVLLIDRPALHLIQARQVIIRWCDTVTDKVVDGITYNVFKDSSDATLAQLLVDQDIDVVGITAEIR